ncbi:MAG: antirestriction protein ArdA [Methylococcaceae bacterium]|nr:antirestriction protein ArdA [Methylococcaceae bacterium]
MSEEIRVYVADLAAYNNSFLHGVWIDATLELDDIQEQVSEILKATPLDEEAEEEEEYAIHDYEGFGAYSVSEYEGLESVHVVACFLEEHGEVAGDVLSHFGGDLEDARKALEENYSGCYSSLADYAEELKGGTAEIPQHLANYIDYERMGCDMEMGGDIFTVETGYQEVHIFWAH